MTRFQILLILAFSHLARAEDVLWMDNKLTPAQPFPGRVLAVESSWGGYRLVIESLGEGEKKYCIAQVWPGGLPHLDFKEIQKSALPEPSATTVFLNPSIEVDRFSWSMSPWKIGRVFGAEDCLKKAIELQADPQKQQGNPTARPKTVLSGKKASRELGEFISERWERQVWQIECRKTDGIKDSSPMWHVKGTMDWVRFEGPDHLREHLDMKKLDPAQIYEITGYPVDYCYSCYAFYVSSIPVKVDVSKLGADAEDQASGAGDIQGRVLNVPIPDHRQRILHKDAEFEITASDYGHQDRNEIALMVHDVRSDRWAILDSVSTIGARFGYVPMDKIESCPEPWDFVRFTQRKAVTLPLGKDVSAVLHFPERIEDKGSYYAVSHDTSWKDDRVTTVLRFDKEALRKIFK